MEKESSFLYQRTWTNNTHFKMCMKKYKNSTNLTGTLNFTKGVLVREHRGKIQRTEIRFSIPP